MDLPCRLGAGCDDDGRHTMQTEADAFARHERSHIKQIEKRCKLLSEMDCPAWSDDSFRSTAVPSRSKGDAKDRSEKDRSFNYLRYLTEATGISYAR